MAIQFDEQSLESILTEVEQLAAPVIKTEARRLAKAAGDGPPPEPDGDEGMPPSPSPEASASPEGSPEGSPPPGPEGSPEGSPPPGPEGSAPADDGFPQDPAELAQMVSQLPREQQEALYLACKQALSASAGPGAPPAGPPAGAPPPGPEASAGGPPPPPPGPAMKSEMKSSPGNGGKSAPIKKNEDDMASNKEVAELKAEIAELKKGQTLVTAGLSRMAGVPMRKSIQGVSQMAADAKTPESEPTNLSKSEIKERISEKIKAGKLSKKDKTKVLDFWEAGGNDQSQIAHLLKDE